MRKNKKKHIGRIVVISFFAIVALVCLIIGVFIFRVIQSAPDINSIDLQAEGSYTSFIYDSEGNSIEGFSAKEQLDYVSITDIPETLQNAFIAVEDERFYEHNGVDYKKFLGAILDNIFSGSMSHGGDTITEEIIQINLISEDSVNIRNIIEEKIMEQYLALEFEKRYTKDIILEYYLNSIHFGEGTRGVQTAAMYYFGKNIGDLSLGEQLVLVPIIQRPTTYNPITNQEQNWNKVKEVMEKMVEQGYLNEATQNEVLESNPYEGIQTNRLNQTKGTRSWFGDMVFLEAVEDLKKELQISEVEAKKLLYGGGLKIYSTLDSHLQSIVDEKINDATLYPKEVYKVNVDYQVVQTDKNGILTSYNDSSDLLESEEEVNAFIEAKNKEWNINHINVEDTIIRKTIQPQTAFALMEAETGAIKALVGGREEKEGFAFNYATQYDMQGSLIRNELSKQGIDWEKEEINLESLLDMSAVYGMVQNEGTYIKPIVYTKIEDRDGNILVDYTDVNKRIVSEPLVQNDIQTLTQALHETYQKQYDEMNQAQKETLKALDVSSIGVYGTLSTGKGLSFIGAMPNCIATIWSGYTSMEPIDDQYRDYPVNLWMEIMKEIEK